MKQNAIFSLVLALFLAFVTVQVATATAPQQTEDQLEHGKYIATIAGCTSCHTPVKAEYQDLPNLTIEQNQTFAFDEGEVLDNNKLLAGGRPFDLGPGGIVFTANLTPDEATGIAAWTDDELKLAIKTGIDNEGKVLFPIMPYHVYSGMADADLDAVIAYIRSVSPVNNQVPERTVSTDGMPTPPYQTGITAPSSADKSSRGAYLVNSVMGCTECHTPVDPNTGAPQLDKYLAGKQPYEGPWGIVYGGNITPDEETGLGTWTDEEVKRAILAGVGKDGRRLILMPWFAYSSLTAEDADAVVYYLKNQLPAVKNEIPAASLNEGFRVLAPEEQNQASGESEAGLPPFTIVIAGVLVILLVSAFAWFSNRKTE